MPTNFPGPYEVRINYNATPASGLKLHQVRFSCVLTTEPDVGDDIGSIDAEQRDGGSQNVEAFVGGLCALLAVRYTTTASFTTAELWRYAAGTFNATWITQWIVDESGVSGSPALDDSQTIFTFRTTGGGFGKLDLRNSISGAAITFPYPTGTASFDDIFDYLSSVDTIAVGRDGGHFVTGINLLQGFNEKMSKDRLRP